MGTFIIIRPKDDAASKQASDWADRLVQELQAQRHKMVVDVDDQTPPNKGNISNALIRAADLVCYFGHGDESRWLTHSKGTIDGSSVHSARAKAVVSVACKTACKLGPDAITAGVSAWLGFTIMVAAISPHKNVDPIGDAVVDGLSVLAIGQTMQEARDEIARLLAQVKRDYDTKGKYHTHPEAALGYYAAMAMSDHVVVHGNVNSQPL